MSFASLKDRLENWGRFQRGGSRALGGSGMHARETRSASPYGGQGYKCMTGVICNLLATSATGPAGWRETGRNATKMTSAEIADAKLITAAYVQLPWRTQSMLKWCYVLNKPTAEICRKLGIRVWPASHFNQELAEAEEAIAKILDSIGKEHTISTNSIPSDKTCGAPVGGVTVSGGIVRTLG